MVRTVWTGTYVRAIVDKLNPQLVKIFADPDMAQRLVSQGTEPHTSTPDGLAQFLREDIDRVRKIVMTAGIRIE